MRHAILALLLLVAVPALQSAAPAPTHDLDGMLQRLRDPDKAKALKALQDVRKLEKFPAGPALRLLPALLWLSDDEDSTVSTESRALVKDLGWPKVGCLECLRSFAIRQDKVYQLMAISGLRKLAFEDPEALLMLLELTYSRNRDTAAIAASTATAMAGQRCPDKGIDMAAWDAWNGKARGISGRFQTAFGLCGRRARGILVLIQKCPGIDPGLVREANTALERIK